ncbi:Acetyltransferase (GNAT) domain-containing protein [Mitsuaria sp. PDC51]|nr:Acetyltransferase (GNAT) domain-containing protein [Mitsuaria sp. PDC51]
MRGVEMVIPIAAAGQGPVWTVRRALPSDAEQIAAHACYREEDAARRAGYAEWVRPRIGSRRYIGFFAMHEGRVIGGAGVVLLDWGPTRANPAGQMGRVANVLTDAALRGRGIATDLVARAMAACEALGVREFNLGATPEGKGLYRSLGFVEYPAEMRRRVTAAP